MKLKLFTTILLLCTFFQSYAYKKQSININVNGQTRSMVVFTPNSLPENSPLFIVTHGMNQDPEYQLGADKMYELIDTAKFVIAYLAGIDKSWDTGGTRDLNFVSKTIEEMVTKYNIDTNRVYWSGFSMGSALIYHGMADMLDKIAAFAPTSGIAFGGKEWQRCSKPVNVIHCHAYGDDVFKYDEWNIRDYVKSLALELDECKTYKMTKNYRTLGGNTGDREIWSDGKNGTMVELFSYNANWHNPSSGNSKEIWNFCKRYSLDPNIPNVKILSPLVTDTYTYLDTIKVEARAYDKDGTIKMIQIYLDGSMRKAFRDITAKDTIVSYDWANPKAGSHTIRVVATDNDNKKKEMSRTITVENPVPIVMTEACYENNSFDLPLTTNSFRYAFDLKVEAENIVAYMTGTAGRVELKAEETGLSNVITLKPVEGAEIQEGTYTLNITKMKDERGVTASTIKFTYTFGVSETSAAAVKYKKPFNEALQKAKDLYAATADTTYNSAEKLRATLKGLIDQYDGFASTSPTAYEEATTALSEATEPLVTRKQNLDDYFTLIAQVDQVIAQFADIESVSSNGAYERLVKARSYYSAASKIKDDKQILNSIKQLTSYLDKVLALTDGINEINMVKEANHRYFNLQGQSINALRKGINIIDGKKVLVK
ncbi:MAG: hypothetical protein J5720_05240 [Bacteroidaceae bacterium]|nr:hypothetical protein [Bacteroidaceae bacterium]